MNPELYEITIRKPVHGTYCSIDLRKLKEAVQNHQMLRITILGKGSAVVDPRAWYDTAVLKEKKVVNYANKPMTFVYNHVQLEGKLKRGLAIDQMPLL